MCETYRNTDDPRYACDCHTERVDDEEVDDRDYDEDDTSQRDAEPDNFNDRRLEN